MDQDSNTDHQSSDKEEDLPANFGVAYRSCNKSFPSGNRLYSHLKSFNAHVMDAVPKVIDLTAYPKGDYPEGITDCTETCVKAFRAADTVDLFVAVVDSGFGRSAVSRKFLAIVSHTVKAVRQLIIRGIGGRQAVNELATFIFYLCNVQGHVLKCRIAALIFDNLGADLLINTDYPL